MAWEQRQQNVNVNRSTLSSCWKRETRWRGTAWLLGVPTGTISVKKKVSTDFWWFTMEEAATGNRLTIMPDMRMVVFVLFSNSLFQSQRSMYPLISVSFSMLMSCCSIYCAQEVTTPCSEVWHQLFQLTSFKSVPLATHWLAVVMEHTPQWLLTEFHVPFTGVQSSSPKH